MGALTKDTGTACVLKALATGSDRKKAQQLGSAPGGSCFADDALSLLLRLDLHSQHMWDRHPVGLSSLPQQVFTDTHERTEPPPREGAQISTIVKGETSQKLED